MKRRLSWLHPRRVSLRRFKLILFWDKYDPAVFSRDIPGLAMRTDASQITAKAMQSNLRCVASGLVCSDRRHGACEISPRLQHRPGDLGVGCLAACPGSFTACSGSTSEPANPWAALAGSALGRSGEAMYTDTATQDLVLESNQGRRRPSLCFGEGGSVYSVPKRRLQLPGSGRVQCRRDRRF